MQQAHNEKHHITPKTIQKTVQDVIAVSKQVAAEEKDMERQPEEMSVDELKKYIGKIRDKMQKAATDLNFEAAAEYRDRMIELKNMLSDMEIEEHT